MDWHVLFAGIVGFLSGFFAACALAEHLRDSLKKQNEKLRMDNLNLVVNSYDPDPSLYGPY